MREVHTTQRTSEYFSEKELSMQLGRDYADWWRVVIKELIDNAIDACESENISPDLTIQINEEKIIIEDNGPGLPLNVVEKSLDYNTRTSSNQVYVSPTRGQLGNALKCAWAAPFVLTGEKVTHCVEANGEGVLISVDYDQIEDEPRIQIERYQTNNVKDGTFIALAWEKIASYQLKQKNEFFTLLWEYSILNPHLSISGEFLGTNWSFPRRDDRAPKKIKWCSVSPPLIHWYNSDAFTNLIYAQVRKNREYDTNTTALQFIRQFKGLSATNIAREVIEKSDCKGLTVTDLSEDKAKRDRLLLQGKTKYDPPKDISNFLGVAGKEALGENVKYKKTENRNESFVVEGWFYQQYLDGDSSLFKSFGLNFTPVSSCPFPSHFKQILDDNLVDYSDPIALHIHIVSPKFHFIERGKGQIILSIEMEEAIQSVSNDLLKQWKKHKKHLRRGEKASTNPSPSRKKGIKTAAYEVMEQAYSKASGNGAYPANARQIMYAARPYILEQTGKDKFDDTYFTQNVLPAFLEEYPDFTQDWRVAYDARGAFIEPHTNQTIGLGTIAVENYINSWRDPSFDITWGINVDSPTGVNRYNGVLFIEKEGFHDLLKHSAIAARYDIAIFSTKGQSNIASRELVAALADRDIPIFCLHDFDISGVGIYWSLGHNTRRYQFKKSPKVIDLGLRLKDVEEWELEPEVTIKEQDKDPRDDLIEKGLTSEEIEFLAGEYNGKGWKGQRVEINSLTAPQFVEFLEAKLNENGIKKVIPEETTLVKSYRQYSQAEKLKSLINELMNSTENDCQDIPDQLEQKVEDKLKANPKLAWEEAIQAIVKEEG